MSGKSKKNNKKSPQEKSKSIEDLPVVEQPLQEDEAKVIHKSRVNNNRNDIVKSRLTLIIDMLSIDDNDDDKTLRKNVSIAVKHIKEVAQML
jgi:hypothetical protein